MTASRRIPCSSSTRHFTLVNHAASLDRLNAVRNRVRSKLEPPQFVEAVVLAFKEVQDAHLSKPIGERFRLERSFEQFQEGIRVATDRPGSGYLALALGCGRGFAGETAQFAADVVQEVV